MSENVCVDCKYFMGFDGVGELWTSCSIHGDFKVKTTSCKYFEKKVTKSDLLNKIQSLEKENEQLKKDVENLQEVVAELGATLLMNGFEIEINGENLSELIDDE